MRTIVRAVASLLKNRVTKASFPARCEPAQLIKDIRAANLTYCGPPKLENLSESVTTLVENGVQGDFVEAGVALGGSAILLGRLKPRAAALHLYDVFGLIPAPGPEDGEDAHQRYEVIKSGTSQGLGSNLYYGYMDNLMEQVIGNLQRFGLACEADRIKLIPGLFQDTLHPSGPIAFAHIDCDWYEPVKTCIDRIVPLLSMGGVIVFDDYSSYSGCRRAVDELIEQRPDMEIIFNSRSIGLRRMQEETGSA